MPHITLDDVAVDFPIYDASHRSVRRALALTIGGTVSWGRRGHVTVRALDGITLDLREGSRTALIGHNGAGKSTLLRILAGLREPTRGNVSIKGRTAALLNLSSILDLEMTGWENIDHACVLLNIPRRQRPVLREEIVDFTELGTFLDLPVKTFSAGMKLRLSFALLTSQAPDILLLDEAFGAGDAHFGKKAERRMLQLRDKAHIVVFASHDEAQVRMMCETAVWLEHGRVRASGKVDEMLAAYGEESSATTA